MTPTEEILQRFPPDTVYQNWARYLKEGLTNEKLILANSALEHWRRHLPHYQCVTELLERVLDKPKCNWMKTGF